MSSILTIGARALRQTLLDEPDVVDLVGNKIFWEHADEDIAYPYIVVFHISGGESNDAQSRAVDYNWKVVGMTANMGTARQLSDAIAKALVRKMPNCTGITDVGGYSWIEELIPVFDRDSEQNTVFFQSGAIYRLQLSLGANA